MAIKLINIDGREALLGMPSDACNIKVSKPFVTLFSASSQNEIDEIMDVVENLLANGCKEFCCLGGMAEQLNDRLDELLEDIAALDVVTTWYEDAAEGCEYFLFAAGAQQLYLVALISQSTDLLKLLASVGNQNHSNQ